MGVGAIAAGLGGILKWRLGQTAALVLAAGVAVWIVYGRGIDAGIERCQAEALAARNAQLERQLEITAGIAAADRAALAEALEVNQRNEDRIHAFEATLAVDTCLLDEPGARLLRDLES